MASNLQEELKQNRPFRSLRHEVHLAILRTAAVLEHAFEAEVKRYGITATQYNVLRILRGAAEAGLCRAEIGERMLRPVADVTRLLDRLEEMRLIVRSRGGEDRRYVTARITREGLEMLESLDPVVNEMHERQLAHIDDSALRLLNDLLNRVRNHSQ